MERRIDRPFRPRLVPSSGALLSQQEIRDPLIGGPTLYPQSR